VDVNEIPAQHDAGRGGDPLWDATFGWFLAFFFLLNIGLGAFSPLLPQIMTDLGLSFAATGLLGSAFGLFRFLVDLPAGILVERLGVSLVLHGAAGLLLAGTLLSAYADSFWAMFAARALLGLGSGMAMVFAVLYLMWRGAHAHRNRRANLYELSVVAGLAISSEVAGMIASRWGWRMSFAAGTAACALAWGVVAWGVLPGMRGLMHEEGPRPSGGTAGRAATSLGPVAAIYALIFAQAFAWGGGISTLLPLLGGQGLSLSSETIGRSMAIAFWVEVCLLFPVGWMADARGKLAVVIPGFLAMLAGTALAPFAQGAAGYGAAFALLTSGMSVWMAVPALLAERMGGRLRGRSAGLYRLVTDFGFIVAPATVGWLIERFGFAAGAAAIVGVLAFSILLGLGFLRKSSLSGC
jgi:MFS family permease